MILFSENSVSDTLRLTEVHAFPDHWTVVLRGAVAPLMSSLFYIFLYPYPAKIVFGFTLRRQRETNALRQAIEDEMLLSQEESRAIFLQIAESASKHKEELDRLNAENKRLRAELDVAVKANLGSKSPAALGSEKLSEDEMATMMLIYNNGGTISYGVILKKSQAERVATEFMLGELERKKLIHKNFDQNDEDYVYTFTHKGRGVVVRTLNAP